MDLRREMIGLSVTLVMAAGTAKSSKPLALRGQDEREQSRALLAAEALRRTSMIGGRLTSRGCATENPLGASG